MNTPTRLLILILFLSANSAVNAQKPGEQWSTEKAWKWYQETPWICGFNYIPANAINYTAMWDKTSFSPELIDKELTLAEGVGFNTLRAVLQFAVWENDPAWFRETFRKFLSICASHNIKVMPSFFDDCVFGKNIDPAIGKQPEPVEGWYAWAWSPSPGHTIVKDTASYFRLEKYVKDIMGAFRNDPSIIAWDLYNEPSVSALENKSYLLVRKVFQWAREVGPLQPLTVGYWNGDKALDDIIFENSDIITFHCYSEKEQLINLITELKKQGRPLICTEWLNRPLGSTVESVLPVFFRENVGCLHWGLINGKTQTQLPWGHRPADLPYKRIWQHDLYTDDYKEYSSYEIKVFKSFIKEAKAAQGVIADETVQKVQTDLNKIYGEKNSERIAKGTAQIAKNWRKTDGSNEDFVKFCMENFLADKDLISNFQVIQQNLALQNGLLAKIRFRFYESKNFTDMKEVRVDQYFRNSMPGIDPYQGKLAQFIQLNFPAYTFEEKRLKGKNWSRLEWAMVKLGDYYPDRGNSGYKSVSGDEVRDFQNYMGKYFFRMDHICMPDLTYPFKKALTLHSHFGLRDNLKEEYTRQGGFARQELTGKIIEHITQGTVPAEFIGDTATRWNPWTNELFKIEAGKAVKIQFASEGTKRYAGLLASFKNRSSEDPSFSKASTVIDRTFENSNFKAEEVEGLIRSFLSDPVIASVGKLISKRLGRPLQPFDIWYSGFQGQSAFPANKLDSITKSRYPDPVALQGPSIDLAENGIP